MPFNLLQYRRQRKSAALCQFELEEKRKILQMELQKQLEPNAVWDAFVQHRWIPPTDTAQQHPLDSIDYSDLRLSYAGYRSAVMQLLSSLAGAAGSGASTDLDVVYLEHPYLSPRTFTSFPRDRMETISTVELFTYVARKTLLFEMRCRLELCATGPHNYLTQDDLEQFLTELVPNLRLVRDMPPWMLPYYLCHASQKFMFMLDTAGVGHVSTDRVLQSDVLTELLRLFESIVAEAMVAYPVSCTVAVAVNGKESCGDGSALPQGCVLHVDTAATPALYTIALLSNACLTGSERSIQRIDF